MSGASLEIDIKYDAKNFERAYSSATFAGSYTANGTSESSFTSHKISSTKSEDNGVAKGGYASFRNGSLWTQKAQWGQRTVKVLATRPFNYNNRNARVWKITTRG